MVIFRNDVESGIPTLTCTLRLALNGSDYELVEVLEDKDIIPDLEISELKTDKGIIYLSSHI